MNCDALLLFFCVKQEKRKLKRELTVYGMGNS